MLHNSFLVNVTIFMKFKKIKRGQNEEEINFFIKVNKLCNEPSQFKKNIYYF